MMSTGERIHLPSVTKCFSLQKELLDLAFEQFKRLGYENFSDYLKDLIVMDLDARRGEARSRTIHRHQQATNSKPVSAAAKAAKRLLGRLSSSTK